MKAALYARVSSRESQDRQDPENQLLRLRAFAEARGYDGTVEYVDHASGADPNRPAMKTMLDAARKREVQDILVVKLDRIMRGTKDLLEIIENLDLWGVGLVCLDQPIETRSAMGKMMITILGALAEYERVLIVERTLDGLARAEKEGRKGGRPRVAVDIDALQRKRAEGLSLYAACKELGIPYSTARDRLNEKRGGGN